MNCPLRLSGSYFCRFDVCSAIRWFCAVAQALPFYSHRLAVPPRHSTRPVKKPRLRHPFLPSLSPQQDATAHFADI